MISMYRQSSETTLFLTMSKKLSDEDYIYFKSVVEETLKKASPINILIVLEDFKGWDLHSFWEDVYDASRHFLDVKKLAFAGDPNWQKWMTLLCKPFELAQVKYYKQSELEDAWKWVT